MSNFHSDRLVVIGVGLIGGSVAAALRRAGSVRRVIGVGRGRANIAQALDLGVIDGAAIWLQSLALTLASFAAAYGLRELIVPGFPRTLAFLASETAATFAVMLAGGVLASLMAIWHALRTPPQLALGG